MKENSEIVEGILEAINSSNEEPTDSCKHGDFGKDNDKLQQCDNCDDNKWKACGRASG